MMFVKNIYHNKQLLVDKTRVHDTDALNDKITFISATELPKKSA